MTTEPGGEAVAGAGPAADIPIIIEAVNLAKSYGQTLAVQDVSFAIRPGTCIGLLGPNGAGKTTTMRMIMGLTRPTGGAIRVFGEPAATLGRAARARIGLVPQDDNLDPDLSVVRNLELYGRYYGLPPARIARRITELLAFMQLETKAQARVNQLSGGMKRRLIIARALIADPDLIILDEPTTGLDPQARVLIWRQLQLLKQAGKTLLLTTHYMDEAERLCDSIILVDHGRILAQDTPDGLIARYVKGHVFEIEKPLPAGLALAGREHEDLGNAMLVFTGDPEGFAAGLGNDAVFTQRPANLEDVFLRLTGRQLREA